MVRFNVSRLVEALNKLPVDRRGNCLRSRFSSLRRLTEAVFEYHTFSINPCNLMSNSPILLRVLIAHIYVPTL
jgi:hypothetical protein